MKDEASSSNLYWLLIQALYRTRPQLAQLAEKHDLTMVQMYSLCSLQPGQALPMHSVSSVLICDASNVTGIVDRLLAHDLISRQEKPEDRRVKMISLTPAGEALRRTLFEELGEHQLPGFSSLTQAEVAQLNNLLEKIVR
jgi:MarR family transcriptional regulator, organic hydroperoxide resistance regulator